MALRSGAAAVEEERERGELRDAENVGLARGGGGADKTPRHKNSRAGSQVVQSYVLASDVSRPRPPKGGARAQIAGAK